MDNLDKAEQADIDLASSIPDSIIEAIYSGKYYLLVGAGISYGETDHKNRILPGAEALLKEIRAYYNLDDVELGLQQTVDILSDQSFNDKVKIDTFLTDRFSGCTSSWQSLILRLNWAMIFTLNIDDVLENSNLGFRKLRSYVWSDAYKVEKSSVQIIHIHGYVHHKPNPDFIFSTTQYAGAYEKNRTWHNIFRETFPNNPYIIIGSTLSNEYDLATAIKQLQSRVDNTLPTILVSPSLNPLVKQSIENKGIVVISATGEDFMQHLYGRYQNLEQSYKETDRQFDFSFSQQFDLIPNSPKLPKGHDFYSGHEPIIQDIKEDLDAKLENTTLLYKTIAIKYKDRLNSVGDGTHLYIIEGQPGSGKSTALLRVVNDLAVSGISCYLFKEPQDTDVDSIIGFCTDKNIVLAFDNVGSYRSSIQEIHSRLLNTPGKHYIIVVDRTASLRAFRAYLASNSLYEDFNSVYSNILEKDAKRIIEKVSEYGRLDRLLDYPPEKRVKVFVSKKLLVNAMYSLSYAKPHKDRMMSDFITLNSEIEKIIYVLTSALSSQGFRLPISWLSAYTGISQIQIDAIIRNINSSALRYQTGTESAIEIQSRVFAEDFMDSKNTEGSEYTEYKIVKFKALESFLTWISKYIDSRSPNFHSSYYRSSSRLLSYSLLSKWFNYDQVNELYKSLRPYWQDNARFWEQYALLSLTMSDYDHSIAYARQAVKIYTDAFTLNTLGLVLVKSSYSMYRAGASESLLLLREGIEYLMKSRESRRGDDYPYITFFSHIRQYARLLKGKDKWIIDELNSNFVEWMHSAKHHPMFSNPKSQENLRRIQLLWLRDISPRDKGDRSTPLSTKKSISHRKFRLKRDSKK